MTIRDLRTTTHLTATLVAACYLGLTILADDGQPTAEIPAPATAGPESAPSGAPPDQGVTGGTPPSGRIGSSTRPTTGTRGAPAPNPPPTTTTRPPPLPLPSPGPTTSTGG